MCQDLGIKVYSDSLVSNRAKSFKYNAFSISIVSWSPIQWFVLQLSWAKFNRIEVEKLKDLIGIESVS